MLRAHQVDRAFRRFCRTGDPRALGRVFDLTAAELAKVLAGNPLSFGDPASSTWGTTSGITTTPPTLESITRTLEAFKALPPPPRYVARDEGDAKRFGRQMSDLAREHGEERPFSFDIELSALVPAGHIMVHHSDPPQIGMVCLDGEGCEVCASKPVPGPIVIPIPERSAMKRWGGMLTGGVLLPAFFTPSEETP